LNSLRNQASKPRRSRTMSDVSQCRQASIRLQRRLSGSMMALEGWYEPRMAALLRRRQAGEEALRNCKGQVMDLKVSLAPLRDDIRRLEVERSCLEKQITLMEIEREERMADHKVGLLFRGTLMLRMLQAPDRQYCLYRRLWKNYKRR
ncbi:hypothetical protein XENOCAPTIV_001342, partial [Xenoophorus captivus]